MRLGVAHTHEGVKFVRVLYSQRTPLDVSSNFLQNANKQVGFCLEIGTNPKSSFMKFEVPYRKHVTDPATGSESGLHGWHDSIC